MVLRVWESVKGFWYDWQLNRSTTKFNLFYISTFSSELNVEKLYCACRKLLDNNLFLGSVFYEKNGEVFQYFSTEPELCFSEYDAVSSADKDRIFDELSNTPFNLIEGPLCRFILIKHKYNGGYSFIMGFHHIIIDGICFADLFDELVGIYNGDLLPQSYEKQFNSYREYSEWILGKFTEEFRLPSSLLSINSSSMSYNPGNKTPAANRQEFSYSDFNSVIRQLPGEVIDEVKSFADQNSFSLFLILKSVWALLIARLSGEEKIVLTYPVSLRSCSFTDTRGYMVNIVPDLFEEKGSFMEQMKKSKSDFREVVGKIRFTPYHKVLKKAESETRSYFKQVFPPVGFGYMKLPDRGFDGENTGYFATNASEYQILLQYREVNEGIELYFSYNKHFFDKEYVDRIFNIFNTLTLKLLKSKDTETRSINLLNLEEYDFLINRCSGTGMSYNTEATIHKVFESRVEKEPDNYALYYDGKYTDYGDLNSRANKLGRLIREKLMNLPYNEADRNPVIGICATSPYQVVISVLGILKAGCAYLIIDSCEPEDRIRQKLEDSDCRLIINSVTGKQFPGIPGEIKDIEAESYHLSRENLSDSGSPDDIAYLLYTSGSTGTPKGVVIEHRGVVDLIEDHRRRFNLSEGSRVLQYHNFSFDVSVSTLFSAILTGASLYLVDKNLFEDVEALQNFIVKERIELINIPPVLLRLMEPCKILKGWLKTIIVGGEVCSAEVMNLWGDKVRLINAYGPTEATVTATLHHYRKGDSNRNIGKPAGNRRVYLLDSYKNPVPPGFEGELFIGGVGVAREYLNQRSLTRDSFLPDPFSANGKGTMYRTGDICRWLDDGSLLFRGRTDDQIKLRGFRIEPGDVVNAVEKFPAVHKAVVALADYNGSRHLTCWYTSTEEVCKDSLRSFLREKLPDYMLPSIFKKVDAIPVNSSGKTDYSILTAGVVSSFSDYVPPVTRFQKKICRIWEEVLKVEKIGIEDDFFSLGGCSIAAVNIVYKIRKELDVTVPVSRIYQYPRISCLVRSFLTMGTIQPVVSLGDHEGESNLPELFIIPPETTGSEIFLELGNSLSTDFRCFGIESFNMYNENFIDDTKKMALYVLNLIGNREKPYWVLGYSLGGRVALEMAAEVERRGGNGLNLILLDTVLYSRAECIGIKFEILLLKLKNRKLLTQKDIDDQWEFSRRIDALKDNMVKMSVKPFAGQLRKSRIILFKATEIEKIRKRRSDKFFSFYFKSLSILFFDFIRKGHNNLNRVTRNLHTIRLNCSHMELLRKHEEIAEKIRDFLC